MAGSTGNLPACHLLGATFASALYSLYVLAFGASIYFLFNVRGRRVQPNRILLAVSVILFLCVTVLWCMHIVYICEAFVGHGDTASGALVFFSGLPPLQVAQLYVYSVTIALLDGALVYRMYVVWGRNWLLVILPCACIAAYMTFATMLLQTSIQISRSLSNPAHFLEALHQAKMLQNDITIAFSLSLVANSFSTAMITIKVLYNGRAMKIAGARTITRPVIHLLLESAAICCACLVITLATFLLNNSGTYFILAVTPMIVGLSYSAIIIRVGLGIAERGSGGSSPLPTIRFSTGPPRFTSQPREHTHASTLAISVDREISVKRDDGRPGTGGVSTRSADPEIALESVDDLSATMYSAKLVPSWEAASNWQPSLPARPRNS